MDYFNPASSMADLKRAAADPTSPAFPKAIKTVAAEFEQIFLEMTMKAARKSLPTSELWDSQAHQTYTEMHDQQLCKAMSAKGLGLASAIEMQLRRSAGLDKTQVSPPTALPLGATPIGANHFQGLRAPFQ